MPEEWQKADGRRSGNDHARLIHICLATLGLLRTKEVGSSFIVGGSVRVLVGTGFEGQLGLCLI